MFIRRNFDHSRNQLFSRSSAVVGAVLLIDLSISTILCLSTCILVGASVNPALADDEYVIARVRAMPQEVASTITGREFSSSADENSFDRELNFDVIRRPRSAASRREILSGENLSGERRDGADYCAALKKIDSSVIACSPNFRRKKLSTPQDPYFPLQWALQSGNGNKSTNAEQGWDIISDASSVAVAIIDGGAELSNPDFVGSLWTNTNEIPGNNIDDDGDGVVDDIHGFNSESGSGDPNSEDEHGNHVTGIIGARANNGYGISGVDQQAQMVIVNATDADGNFTTASFVRALDYLVMLKKKKSVPLVAVNASFGGYQYSEVEALAIERLRAAGILLVTAAGNEGLDNDTFPLYPASYRADNVISVAALDQKGALAYFSNYGLMGVDIAAPGVGIVSCVGNGKYAAYDGTSMAAPFVTGALGLLAALRPDLDYRALRSLLLDTARPDEGLSSYIGAGALDLERVLSAADPKRATALAFDYTPIDRDAAFMVSVTVKPKAAELKRVQELEVAFRRSLASRDSKPATLYLSFAVSRISCGQIVRVSDIEQLQVVLGTVTTHVKGITRISVKSYTGNSQLSNTAHVLVHGTRIRANTRKNFVRSASYVSRVCADLRDGLTIQ